jgi:Lon protease-like protein
MIGECLEEGNAFGIVYSDGRTIEKVGCVANVLKVIKRYGDGRMDIVTKGDKRFLIQNIIETKAYLEAEILYFDDHGEEDTLPLDEIIKEKNGLLKEIVTITGKEEDVVRLSELDSKEFVISCLQQQRLIV